MVLDCLIKPLVILPIFIVCSARQLNFSFVKYPTSFATSNWFCISVKEPKFLILSNKKAPIRKMRWRYIDLTKTRL